MKILLTGATGFLGSALLKTFLSEGYEVCILKRSFSDSWRIKNVLADVIAYDVDQIPLSRIFKEHADISLIVHTAANYGRGDCPIDKVFNDNVFFPLNLIEQALKSGSFLNFINTDTFYTKPGSSYSHLAYYTWTKRYFLDWLKLKSQRIAIRNLRLEHIYGPQDRDDKFIQTIFQQLIRREESIDLTTAEHKRDFVFIEDVVSAFMTIIKSLGDGKSGFQEYEIGAGEAVAIKDFLIAMSKVVGSSTRLRFGKLPLREGEILESRADISALQQLGWEVRYPYLKGLEKLFEYYQQQKLCEIKA